LFFNVCTSWGKVALFYTSVCQKSLGIFDGFGWKFSLILFNGGTNRAVKRSWFTVTEIFLLFEFGIDERIVTVLADEDFIGHKDIIANKKAKTNLGRNILVGKEN